MFQKGANLAAMLVVSRYNYPVQTLKAMLKKAALENGKD